MADSTKSVIRADHCGSFLRPQALKDARFEHAMGRIDDAGLRAVEDEAILGVIETQRRAGLGIYSDGEFRRKFWHSAIVTAFEGIEDSGPDYSRFPGLTPEEHARNPDIAPPSPLVVGRLAPRSRLLSQEVAFLRQHAPGPVKVTVPSPVMLLRSAFRPGTSDRTYSGWDEFFQDFARHLAGEIEAAVAAGVDYVQLDAPGYNRYMVPERRAEMAQQGIDPDRDLDAVLAAENECLRAARRPGVTVAVHVCFGTYIRDGRGPQGGPSVALDPAIVGKVLNVLEADRFLFEYTARAGALESLREAPKGKTIALGLINIRDPRVETEDELRSKLEEAAHYVAMDDLALCPSCGFSAAAADAWITEDVHSRKLDALVRAAAKAWG